MKHNWDEISKLPILGLKHTVEDFQNFLKDQNCLFFPWGGSVRDLVLGRFVADIDAQITCDPRTLRFFCEEKYGLQNCHHHHRGSYKLVVGSFPSTKMDSGGIFVQPLDLAHWNTTFEVKKAQLEYVVNTLAYYVDQNILIDVSGKALEDVCGFKIRIPADPLFWEEWMNENAMNKLLRYWSLRSKGFSPFGKKVRQFILQQLKSNFNPKKALFFVCHKFYEGKLDESDNCQVFNSIDVEKKVVEKVGNLQKILTDLDGRFNSTNLQPLKSLHVTLNIFKITDKNLNSATEALQKCAKFIGIFADYPLIFDKFNEFENATLYAGVDEATEDNLKWIEKVCSHYFSTHNITPLSQYSFHPHMTVVDLKPHDPELARIWKPFVKNARIGSTEIHSLQLCKMKLNGSDYETIVEESIHF